MKVLFVDDEPNILDGISRLLLFASEDTDVDVATNGAEALSRLESQAADVVITDMRMPVMDGMQLLTQVRARWPNIVRIVLTGEPGYEAAVRMVPIAHQYLLKPCSGEELLGVIARTRTVLERLENPNVRDLVGGLSALPSVPETYQRLSEALEDPATPPSDIARIVESDPPVALKLLQLANSAFFARRVATRDVAGAVVQLGVNTIRHVVLQLAAFQLAAGVRPSIQAHLRQVQSCSVRIADCARGLIASSAQGSEAFMAGLLCDIGQVILATAQEAQWAEVLEISQRTGAPIEVVEKQVLGVSHTEVGALLMGFWGLPHFAVESAACHHDRSIITPKKLDVVSAVCLASLLIDAKSDDDALWDELGVRACIEEYRALLDKKGRPS